MDERFMATKICNKLVKEQTISEKDFKVDVLCVRGLLKLFSLLYLL